MCIPEIIVQLVLVPKAMPYMYFTQAYKSVFGSSCHFSQDIRARQTIVKLALVIDICVIRRLPIVRVVDTAHHVKIGKNSAIRITCI